MAERKEKMDSLNSFCTCTDVECPMHPAKTHEGCTPCIVKNLRLGEIPSCFFNKIPGAERRTGHSYRDFAEAVLSQESGGRPD